MRKLTSIFLFVLLSISVFSFYKIRPIQATFGSEDIFFEYGAESGDLQPPWDAIEGDGSDFGLAQTSTSQARTGTKSIYMYQKAPPKTDHERRVHLREYGVNYDKSEGFVSWWMYVSPQLLETTDTGRVTLGGWQLWFGPSGSTWMWWEGGRFRVMGDKRIQYSYKWGNAYGYGFDSDASAQKQESATSYDLDDYENQWVHFQIYWKIAESNGECKFWFNDNLVADITGLHSDPRYYTSSWNDNPNGGQTYFRWSCDGPYPNFGLDLYQDQDSFENWIWVDDVVASDEKVTEEYGVGYTSLEFESWEDGFESGDFSEWNGTQQSGGGVAPSVTSTYSYTGTYSANFTTDGSEYSYSRAMYVIQDTNEVYQRSYVRFEELPDTDDTIIWVLRVAQNDGTWISSAGVNRTGGSYFWHIQETGGTRNYTMDTINADQWYELEFYFNATTDGRARLWVNGTLMNEMTGDFTDDLARVYPYLYCDYDDQASAKTVYHDNYRVDNIRIGGGTTTTFQGSIYFSAIGETDPLQYVTINGTKATDASGYYEWSNLTYNEEHCFVIGNVTGYYPAWILNVDGSFEWNGSDYLIRHNVTEDHSGYIQIRFNTESEPFISYSTAKIISVSLTSTTFNIVANDTGTKWILVNTTDRIGQLTVTGANYSFDFETKLLNLTVNFSSQTVISISWGQDIAEVTELYSLGFVKTLRKTFYANERFWIFFSDGSDMVYSSSVDASSGTWHNPVTIRNITNPYGIANGRTFSVVYNGSVFAYAWADESPWSIKVRVGTPLSNGSISWIAGEQSVSMDALPWFPHVEFDTEGFIWIGYCVSHDAYVIKNSWKNGSWNDASGFPLKLFDGTLNQFVSPLPLLNGEMYVLWRSPNTNSLYGKKYEQGSWSIRENITNAFHYSVSTYNGEVFLAGQSWVDTSEVFYMKRASSNQWSTKVVIEKGSSILRQPQLTQANDITYIFLVNYPEDQYDFYRVVESTVDSVSTIWISEPDTLTWGQGFHISFIEQYNNRIGLVYMATPTSPYKLKFAWFYTTTSGNFLLEGYDGVTLSSITYNALEGKLTFTSTGSGSAIVRGTDTTLTVLVNGSAWSGWSSDQNYITISALSGTSNITLYSVIEDFPSSDRSDRDVRDDLDVMEILKPIIPPLSVEGLMVILGGVGVFVVGAFYTKIRGTRTRGISKPQVPRISKPRGVQPRPTPRKRIPKKHKKARRSGRFVK